MDPVMTLPNELLLLIFAVSPTLGTAVRLSSVNRRLQSIWLDDHDQTITAILRREVPEFEDAVDLAVSETRLKGPLSISAAASWRGWLQSCPWLPRLLQNDDFASSASAEFHQYIQGLPEDDPWYAVSLTSWHASYYMVRQLVLGYEHQDVLLTNIRKFETGSSESEKTRGVVWEFLCHFMSEEEQARQGIRVGERDWARDDGYGNVNKAEWDSTELLFYLPSGMRREGMRRARIKEHRSRPFHYDIDFETLSGPRHSVATSGHARHSTTTESQNDE